MTKTNRSPITTHVLDLNRGLPAARLPVTLEVQEPSGQWKKLGGLFTDDDGRIEDLLPRGSKAKPGTYQLTFDTATYFESQKTETFYPRIAVIFRLTDSDRHHHVPLLLSSFGYSTYRGT